MHIKLIRHKSKQPSDCRKIIYSPNKVQVKVETFFANVGEEKISFWGDTDTRQFEFSVSKEKQPTLFKRLIELGKSRHGLSAQRFWIRSDPRISDIYSIDYFYIKDPRILFDNKPACHYEDTIQKFPYAMGWIEEEE